MKYSNHVKILALSSVLFILGCSGNKLLVGPNEEFVPSLISIPDNKSQLVIFREPSSNYQDSSILVTTNEQIVAGLPNYGYATTILCPKRQTFTFTLQKTQTSKDYTVEPKKNVRLYIKVFINDNGMIILNDVNEDIALGLMKNNKYKSYLINRSEVSCSK